VSRKTTEPYVDTPAEGPLFEAPNPDRETKEVTLATPHLPRERSMLDRVLNEAIGTNLDPERLEKFLAIARELELDKKKQEWSTAFRAAKNEIDCFRITKRGRIVYKNGSIVKFIKYEDMSDAVKPILRKHALSASYSYRYEQNPPKAICIMTLTHANGYSQKFDSVPLPMIDTSGGKSDLQGSGSVMSYGIRYVTRAAFDIVAEDEDTDGNGAPGKPITANQLNDINIMVQDCETKEPAFTRRFMRWLQKELHVDALEDLYQGEPRRIVLAKLGEKQRELGL
jgi:ERF superfamily